LSAKASAGTFPGIAPASSPPQTVADSDRREPWTRQELVALIAILDLALAFSSLQLDMLPAGAQHGEVFDGGFALSTVNGARPVFFEGQAA
jgi:hypothetical protein